MAKFFDHLPAAELVSKLKENILEHSAVSNKCVTWTGNIDKYGYGYIRFTVDGRRLKVRAHRLQFFLADPIIPLHPAMHVSHLCHEKLCVNLAHLSYEPAGLNNSRQGCYLDQGCKHHHGFKDCIFS